MPIRVRAWLSLVAVIWLQSVNGTNSDFPAYSSQLKQMMSISQLQLNNLAFASDAGKLFGWISGVAALFLPLWLVLLIGAFLSLLSYGLQYLFLNGQIPGAEISYPVLFLLTVLAGNSICWINTVCYAIIIANFPSRSRQVAVGITTSYQGLSANIYTDVVSVFAPEAAQTRGKSYLLFNSILPAIVSVVTAPIVGHGANECCCCDHDDDCVRGSFGVLFVITFVTGAYAVVSSLGAISTGILPVYILTGIILLLMSPLVVPLKESIRGSWWANRQHQTQIHDLATPGHDSSDGGLVITKQSWSARWDHDEGRSEPMDGFHKDGIDAAKEEVGVKTMLTRFDFWLYFFVYLFSATLGLVYLNNLGQITESRGSSRTSSLVSLSSAFGFFGRLLPSILDYLFSRQPYMVSRPACLAALTAPMAGSFVLLLSSSNLCLYISTTVISICTGAITSVSVSLTTELFGKKNFSVNHNVLVANIPIGSFIFGYLAGVMYRREGSKDGKCTGTECYRTSFVIWGSLCFLGTSLALLLYARSRNFYLERSTRRSQSHLGMELSDHTNIHSC